MTGMEPQFMIRHANPRSSITIPTWVAALAPILTILLTIGLDRITVASALAGDEQRIANLESLIRDGQKRDEQILARIDAMASKLDANGLAIQKITDRQQVVLNRLGMPNLADHQEEDQSQP